MTFLRLVNNSMFRVFTRDLRGVSKRHPEPLTEPEHSSDKPLVKLDNDPDSAQIDNSKRSYRTFRQKVKNLKRNCSCQLVTKDNQYEMVKNAVTMFHHIPYFEQLQLKQTKHQDVLDRLKNMKSVRHQVNCKTEDIVASPRVEEYRNKDMFSVGHDIQGRVTVGYHVGGRREGVVCVGPGPVKIIKSSHKKVAALYEEFLSEIDQQRVSVYQGEQTGWNTGNWSELMVRSNFQGQIMVKVLYFTNDEINKQYEVEKNLLMEKFLTSGLPISSIFVTEVSRNQEKKRLLLHGEDNFVEKIGNLRMRLGPDTFCQVNPDCAELLLGVVRRAVLVGRNRTLLDLCCGAGMFSLYLSRHFRGTIGLDLEDTKYALENAAMNNIGNCGYITGRIQNILPSLLTNLKTQSVGVSAVLNPGRSGVDQSVIRSIRKFPLLDNLVYISCQPEDPRVVRNFVNLMSSDSKNTSSKHESKPFTLKFSVALDMFPHTHHCEHVFVFRR